MKGVWGYRSKKKHQVGFRGAKLNGELCLCLREKGDTEIRGPGRIER